MVTSIATCVLTLATRTIVAAPAAPPMQVQATDDAVRLSNGRIELAIDRGKAALTHLAVPGGPELVKLGYYDTNGSPGGFEDSAGYLRFGHHEPVIATVARRSPDLVDIALRTDASGLSDFHHPLRTEFHYILRRGDPGFYVYWVRWHEEGMRGFNLGQTRYVIKAPRRVFDRWQISDDRAGVFPTGDQVNAAERAYDATIRLPDGRYMTKYSNAVPIADHHLCGLYSSEHRTGLWQINAGNEYINGGPRKQILTIHQATPIILHMVHSGHFLGPDSSLHIDGDWAKVYGPVFYYVNGGASLDKAWEDAKERLQEEQESWPYEWVSIDQARASYPIERGTVRGRVKRADGGSAGGAMAILGAPEPDWQLQGLGYMYWGRVGRDGAFEIADVRPGEYTLYVYQDGVYGKAVRDGVQVSSDGVTDVGEITLAPENAGSTIWQIGTPDRTAAEYRHGNDFRQVYLHRRYDNDFPDDVTFVIGESAEARDWNYYQPGGRTWRVVFDRAGAPETEVVLTLAIAASSYRPAAAIAVRLNDHAVGNFQFEDGNSALWRLGIYDRYQCKQLRIEANQFTQGRNVLTLELPRARSWVMYDFLRLEFAE